VINNHRVTPSPFLLPNSGEFRDVCIATPSVVNTMEASTSRDRPPQNGARAPAAPSSDEVVNCRLPPQKRLAVNPMQLLE